MKKIGFFVLAVLLVSLMAFSAFAATYDCSIGAHELLPEQWSARPDCGKAWAAYQCCARCDFYIQTNVKIAEHNYVNGVCEYCNDGATHTHSYYLYYHEEASCSTSGRKYYKCACGDTYSVYVEPYSHSYIDGRCEYCGMEKDCDHDFGSWTIEKDSTCATVGSKYRICLDCSYKQLQEISKKDHEFSNGSCKNCGVVSDKLCSHELTDWLDDPNNTDVCGDEIWIYRYCLFCGMVEWKNGTNEHDFLNYVCTKCGVFDENHKHSAQRAVILGDHGHQKVCACGYVFEPEEHSYIVDSVFVSDFSCQPVREKSVCEACKYERVYYKLNSDLKILTLSNGIRVSYAELVSYDCLYYEYNSLSSGSCQIGLLTDDGRLYKQLTLPKLKQGEKILVDTLHGWYCIWDNVVEVDKTVVKAEMLRDNNGKFDFTPNVETLPSPLDRCNAYFETDYQDRYNYPVIDYNLRWQNVNYLYPYCVNVTGNVIQLRSFPQSTLAELIADIEQYPLTFVIYDSDSVKYTSVTSSSDAFVAAWERIAPSGGSNSGGSTNNGSSDVGGAYALGYADAYNILTNAVIEKAPFQGFVQGMWYGVLAMVTILGNGISFGGVSLYSVLISVLVLVALYFLYKVLRK